MMPQIAIITLVFVAMFMAMRSEAQATRIIWKLRLFFMTLNISEGDTFSLLKLR